VNLIWNLVVAVAAAVNVAWHDGIVNPFVISSGARSVEGVVFVFSQHELFQ
jgi:hypothetical protein